MVHLWHDISPKKGSKINVIIEIPSGSKIKYELDKENGVIKVDRILNSSVFYPGNYGFIPQTLEEDSDPLDVLVISQSALQIGTLVECNPIGVLITIDDGKKDYKILCVPASDPYFKKIKDIKNLSQETKMEIQEFFKTYKSLEKKKMEVKSTRNKAFAEKVISKSIENYKKWRM